MFNGLIWFESYFLIFGLNLRSLGYFICRGWIINFICFFFLVVRSKRNYYSNMVMNVNYKRFND